MIVSLIVTLLVTLLVTLIVVVIVERKLGFSLILPNDIVSALFLSNVK